MFLNIDYFSSSGSFSYTKAELYKKGLKAFYKLCRNVLNLQPSVFTSLHLFDHTVKPILLYSSQVWGCFNPFSSKFRNGLSLDKIYQNNDPDKLHMKFAKFTLGVHKKSSNFNGALLTAYLFLLTPNATARKRNELTRGTSLDRVDSELVKCFSDCAGK